jgi:ADP-ribosyl-[dinitrogen reductase] hydrolase
VTAVLDAFPQRIRAGILAYAAGDALGVPWEGKPASQVKQEALEELPPRDDWPRGATSDDTAQMLLVARHLVESKGQGDDREFLILLAGAFPTIRGAGPTTTAAVRRFIKTGEARPAEGTSNGAAMRAPPIGWATPVTASAHRRELTIRLSRATHGSPLAIAGACMVSAMAACAIEQGSVEAIVGAGLVEAEQLARLRWLNAESVKLLRQVAAGQWSPPTDARPLDAVATVASVMHVLRKAESLAAALRYAVSLGGDTDTVAAITGGVLGCRVEDIDVQIPWLPKVLLPEPEVVEQLAEGLSALRDSPQR